MNVYNKSMKTSNVKDARKIKYTNEQVRAICLAWEEYVNKTEFPYLSEFLAQPEIHHKYKLSRQYIQDHPELFDYYTSYMEEKSQAYLVGRGLRGVAMPMVIFMLKQRQYGGYTDRNELDLKSGGQPIKFENRVPRPTDKKSTRVKTSE